MIFNTCDCTNCIKKVNILITNLEKDQLRYDSLITGYKDSLIVMDHQIDSTKHEIKQIQNYYGKKIKNLSGATHTELTDFFTDRYK